MIKITLMLLLVESVNWFTNWPLGWQIFFTIAGIGIWSMFYAIDHAVPNPDEPTPKYYSEGIWIEMSEN